MKLTEEDLNTIRFALNCAIEERESFAEAYSNVGPEAERALSNVKRFEKLHKKLFNEASTVQQSKEYFNSLTKVSLHELKDNSKDA
jgi:hypothetical protein